MRGTRAWARVVYTARPRMNLAWLSLSALVITIIISCFSELNVGVLALALAWIIGVFFAGMTAANVAGGFPVALFITLIGVTLLFTQAQLNGTLDKIAHRAMAVCRGNVGLMPIMFFVLTSALASIGPGNIASAALVAPMAMAVAVRAGIPVFLMAIMVGNGANSGALSPFAPTGIIASGLMMRIGLPGYEWSTFFNNLGAHAVIAFAAYFLLGGWKLFGLTYTGQVEDNPAGTRLDAKNWITLAVVAALILAVLVFRIDVGMGALAAAVFLTAFHIADHKNAIRNMPWPVIMMVAGMTVLISILEKTKGLDLFTALLARLATTETITGVIAFVAGLVSVYASTSGVVLPAFLPTVPGLIERLGGGDPLAIASSINVGGHLVDVSPLSTIGALCIAALPASEDYRTLFNKLIAWGLSMSVVGAIACYLLF